MVRASHPGPARTRPPWSLTVGVRAERQGPELTHEPVTEPDLSEPVSESWLDCVVRRGGSRIALDDVDVRIRPVLQRRDGRCGGYVVRVTAPGGLQGSRAFTSHSLAHVADRAARRLLADGRLGEDGLYFYRLFARRADASTRARAADGDRAKNGEAASATGIDEIPFATSTRTRPIEPLAVALAPLLATARHVGPDERDALPVLYTETALACAEGIARSGARSNPPIETGGVLLGPLCLCPDSGELFVVVVDVLEATDADQQQFSLSYSSRTWARIQSVVRAVQSDPARRAWRIVGQTHGHNFPPVGGGPCEECSSRPECDRSSVFVSDDDLDWSRAVFRGQPWQLSHIFGENARGEEVHGLFGLRDGRLLRRGFHVIPDFDREES